MGTMWEMSSSVRSAPPRVPCGLVADGWKRRESPRSVFLAEEGGEGWLAVEKPTGI